MNYIGGEKIEKGTKMKRITKILVSAITASSLIVSPVFGNRAVWTISRHRKRQYNKK